MQCSGVKSSVDDLALGRGVVLSRAATTLRSIETKPFDWRFVRARRACISEERGAVETQRERQQQSEQQARTRRETDRKRIGGNARVVCA